MFWSFVRDNTLTKLLFCLNQYGVHRMLTIVLTFLCLFGFLIKGGNAEIPAGTLCNATVAGNTTINVD